MAAARINPGNTRVVSRCAVAAGPTMRAKTSSTPTICAQAAVVSPTRPRNNTPRARMETPLASASSGFRLENSKGREMIASVPRASTVRPSSS